jgi:DNA repair protein RadD
VAMDKATLIGDVVEHYQRLAPGQQGIVFAVSREHSRHIAEAFCAAGVKAEHVDGSMKDRDRSRIVDGFRGGEVRVMVNVDLFGEGFDVPGLVYVGLARPTKSLALHLQQVGRSLRVMPGKAEAIICDHAGNAFAHGLPDDERAWSLQGRKKGQGRAASDASPIHQCPDCFRVSYSSSRECPGCGHVFAVQSRAPEQKEGELYELKGILAKEEAAKKRKAEERECKTLADFIRLGMERSYQNPGGWARMQMQVRHNYSERFRRRA